MTKNGCLLPFVVVACFPVFQSCVVQRQAYYVSPFNGNNTEYHSLPAHGDSVRSAVYAKATYFAGSSNDYGTDHSWDWHAGIYAGHHYGMLQFFYGVDLTLGNYFMGKWAVDTPALPYRTNHVDLPYAATLNTYSRGYFFGGAGFQAGLNGVIPFGKGEWRFLGIETSVSREFGNYLSVRQKLPDSIATLIIRNPLFATFGVNTELVGRTGHGEFGFRWALGWAIGSRYSNTGIYDNEEGASLRYAYFNFSFHYTYRQLTGYMQLNAATKATAFVLGANYRLWAHATRKTGLTDKILP